MGLLTADNQAQAAKLYQDAFGRAGDQGGINYWAQQIASGKPMSEVQNAFGAAANKTYSDYAANPQAYDAANPGLSNYFKNDPGAVAAVSANKPQGLLSAPAASVQPATAPSAPVAIGYMPSNASAVQALAQGYTSAPTTVSPEATSQYQLARMLDTGSPLMQQAQTAGLQAANQRGLLNSSIAVGAAQDAMIRNAQPFASQDASTYAQAGAATTAAENAARQFGAGSQNTAALQNAQAGTNVSLANAQATNTASQFGAGEQNKAALTDVENQMRTTLANLQANTQMSVTDKELASRQALSEAQNKTNLIISQGDNATKTLLDQIDNAARLNLAQVDQDTKLKIASLDSSSKENLTRISANNDQLLRTNANAAAMWQQYVTNLANISTNTNMDAAAKQQAADNQINALNAGLRAVSEISGLNLAQYFPEAAAVSQPAAQQTGLLGSQPATNER